ncbi:MAG: hypothetical protein ABII90_03855 [Bacteroidota bacterium]
MDDLKTINEDLQKTFVDEVKEVVNEHRAAAIGGGLGAAIGAAVGGHWGAAGGGLLGGLVGSLFDQTDEED